MHETIRGNDKYDAIPQNCPIPSPSRGLRIPLGTNGSGRDWSTDPLYQRRVLRHSETIRARRPRHPEKPPRARDPRDLGQGLEQALRVQETNTRRSPEPPCIKAGKEGIRSPPLRLGQICNVESH